MWILLIAAVAFFIRLINLNQSLWLDEAINIVYASTNSFSWFVTKYPLGDFHPPGFFAILWVWGHLFGFSEISVRLPSVIFGVATVWLTYIIGKELFSQKVGLLAAIFLALAPLHIYYSQEARMYSLAAFTVTLSNYFLILLLKNQKYASMGYAFSVALVLYSDYVAYFIFPAQIIYVLLYQRKKIKRVLLPFCFGFLALVPWLFVLPGQLFQGRQTAFLLSRWGKVVGGASLKAALLLAVKTLVGRVDLENNAVYTGVVTATVMPYLIVLLKLKQGIKVFEKLALYWLLIPPTIAFLFSFYIPVFSYFRMIFILPAFYILIAALMDSFGRHKYGILAGIIIISELIFSLIYLLNPQFHRENWKDATSFVKSNMNNQTVVLFKNNEILAPFLYYNPNPVSVYPAFIKIPVSSLTHISNLNMILGDKKQVYVFDYLVEITDPEKLLDSKLNNLGFNFSETYNFRGVGFIDLYKR